MAGLGLSDRAMVLDIGANKGQAARSMLSVLPRVQVISFEPNPDHRVALGRMRTEIRGFSFFECGLGERESSMWLYWPVYNGCEFTPLASLSEEVAAAWLNPRTLFGFRPEKLVIRKSLVKVRVLDEFGLSPEFIKVDVEGASLGVLKGARGTIQRSRPILLVEEVRCGDAVDRLLLGEMDYVPFARSPTDGTLEAGKYGTGNTFFIPKEHSLVRQYSR